jgi:hypothetical protein
MPSLIQFTAHRAHQQVPVWVNPERIIFVEPRYSVRGVERKEVIVGTRLHLGTDTSESFNAVLELVEEPDEVLALLAGHDYDRELKLDLTYEAARADLIQVP